MSDASTAATASDEGPSDAESDGDLASEFDGVAPRSQPTFGLHRALESPVSVVRLAEFDEPCLPVRRDPPRRRRAATSAAAPSPASHTDLIPAAAWQQARARASARARAPVSACVRVRVSVRVRVRAHVRACACVRVRAFARRVRRVRGPLPAFGLPRPPAPPPPPLSFRRRRRAGRLPRPARRPRGARSTYNEHPTRDRSTKNVPGMGFDLQRTSLTGPTYRPPCRRGGPPMAAVPHPG